MGTWCPRHGRNLTSACPCPPGVAISGASTGFDDVYRVQTARIADLERQLEEAKTEHETLLRRNGFRPCDISACNCGSWHQIDGWPARFREIDDATDEYWQNGETLLQRVTRIVARAQTAEAEAAKLRAEHRDRVPSYMVCNEHPFIHVTDPMGTALGCWKCKYDKLRAVVERVAVLPEKWRDEQGTSVAETKRECADELQAALNTTEDEK